MLCWFKPDPNSIARFISANQSRTFSYAEAGSSQRQAPSGYNIDHNRVKLGEGSATFERAKLAIAKWKMFDMPWVELCQPDRPIEPGATVAILVKHFGFWSLNAARIVYVIDEHGPIERFGFAYGTLPDHHEIGEERFSVEIHRDDESVWYDLFAFSRPRGIACLAYPVSRALQRRFAVDSLIAMQRATRES